MAKSACKCDTVIIWSTLFKWQHQTVIINPLIRLLDWLFIYENVFLFFVTLGATGFLGGLFLVALGNLALGFTGLALSAGTFERLGLGFFTFWGLRATTTFLPGGEMLSGQDVKTWTSLTLWPLSSGGCPQLAVTSKLTFSIHLRDGDGDRSSQSNIFCQ